MLMAVYLYRLRSFGLNFISYVSRTSFQGLTAVILSKIPMPIVQSRKITGSVEFLRADQLAIWLHEHGF
jgi:hypothetical protein